MSDCMLFNVTEYPCIGGATTISCMSPGEIINHCYMTNYTLCIQTVAMVQKVMGVLMKLQIHSALTG